MHSDNRKTEIKYKSIILDDNRNSIKSKIAFLYKHLYLYTGIILSAGIGSAISIYLAAGNSPGTDYNYEFEHSKVYIHDLELYGGKFNVLANELMSWFDGLWHGRSLAYTVAVITVLISIGFYFIVDKLQFEMESDVHRGDGNDGTA